jgi:F0F1-type ATP synthase assembly protein I
MDDNEERGNETRRHSSSLRLGRLSGIIAILPASMAAGWILGYFLVDHYLHIFPWGSIILTLLGAGAGFYEILNILAPEDEKGDHTSDRES